MELRRCPDKQEGFQARVLSFLSIVYVCGGGRRVQCSRNEARSREGFRKANGGNNSWLPKCGEGPYCNAPGASTFLDREVPVRTSIICFPGQWQTGQGHVLLVGTDGAPPEPWPRSTARQHAVVLRTSSASISESRWGEAS